eukprot:m.24030 g.24030  ORF g.24030 m.24030 type:complete len:236 (+) comp28565_c0_seq1:2200-2907(+)
MIQVAECRQWTAFSLFSHSGFILDTLCGYVRTGSYSIVAMEKREMEIKKKAEEFVSATLPFHKRILFNWVLSHARRAVKHRENLRFARTKLWGILRSLFRAIGENLKKLGLIDDRQDVFYLTIEELFAFADGRSVTNNLRGLTSVRKEEIEGYKKALPPPERFMTRGAAGCYMHFPAILEDLDLLKELEVVCVCVCVLDICCVSFSVCVFGLMLSSRLKRHQTPTYCLGQPVALE